MLAKYRFTSGTALAEAACSLYVLYILAIKHFFQPSPVMADQIVITEKSSQAKDVRARSEWGRFLWSEWMLPNQLYGCFSFFAARNCAVTASFSHIYAPRLVVP